MNPPVIESTETLSKYDLAVYIFDAEDGHPPVFKIASILPGSRVWFDREELERFYPKGE